MNTELQDIPPRSHAGDDRPAVEERQPARGPRYDSGSALLHWLLVLLMLAQLGLGWFLRSWPQVQPNYLAAYWVHMSLGISIAGLLVVTLLWRLIFHSPIFRSSASPRLVRTERLTAAILYLLLILMLLSGYLGLVFDGEAVLLWTLQLPNWGWKDPNLVALYNRWHYGAAIALSAAVGLHMLVVLGAALRARGPRSRMRPSLQRRAPAPPKPAPLPGSMAGGRRLARHLRIFGWMAFWVQLCLGLVALLLLIVTASSKYYSSSQLKIPYGLAWAEGASWAHLAIAVLAVTVVGFLYCTRLARALRIGVDPLSCQRRITRLISGINFGSSLGLSIAILGTAFSIALLIAKTVSQPPGIAITNPQKIVRAVDVFVLLANFNVVVAHFIGILICLWMLNRVHRFYLAVEIARAANR
jgi:cytochrome b561